MRFFILGTDAAGVTVDLTLDARNADEAEHLARQRGIQVTKVWIGSGGAACLPEPIPPAPAACIVPVEAAPVVPSAVPISAAPPGPGTRLPPFIQPPGPAKPRVNLGLTSLSLGGAALLFCWIPTVGIISWPLCLAGLGAGGLGLIRARRRADAFAPPAIARAAPSLCGLGLSLLTVLAGTVAAGAGAGDEPSTSAPSTSAPPPTTRPERSADPVPEKKQRQLSIVVGASSDGATLEHPSAAAAVPPAAPVPAMEPVRVGSAEFRVVSCEIAALALVGDQGRNAGITAMPLLAVKVEVRNTGEQPITYTSLAGDDEAGLRDGANLKDDRGRMIRRAQFTFSIIPAGRTRKETIAPGKSVTDLLAFERPVAGSTFFTLQASGRCIGASAPVSLNIPAPIDSSTP